MYNKTRNNIENRLEIDSLAKFVDILIEPYKIEDSYPTLNTLIRERLIKKIIINSKISTDAYIKRNEDYFELTLKKEYDPNNVEEKFLLAHEVAHTFLYEIKNERIFDSYLFNKSSFEQEYFCNFFARALLIPTKEIISDFSETSSLKSLKIINQLAKKYNVPYNELIKRILNDLEIFKDTVIIRFVNFPMNENWKLFESYMSESIRYNKAYFIPRNNFDKKNKYTERFPSCSEKLSKYLDDLYKQIKTNEELHFDNMSIEIFSEKPVKHFAKNLTSTSAFTFTKVKDLRKNNKFINVLINLNYSTYN